MTIDVELMNKQRAARLSAPKLVEPIRSRRSNGNISKGNECDFWNNVDQVSDELWLWTGATNGNHNTEPHVKDYQYGHFVLDGHKSHMAHRVVIFLVFGIEVPDQFKVSNIDENRLNIAPLNLGIRCRQTGSEWTVDEWVQLQKQKVN